MATINFGSGVKLRAGPSGLHVFDRATGLNILVDEVQVPQQMWATAPRQVSVALTNACDLSCPYCFAPKSPAALGVERLFSWLTELDTNGCFSVGFGGGEPTLYRPFPEVCAFATQNTGLAVTFTTHGHRLDESLVSALAGHVHFVRVSMDGVGATYEALRGRSFATLRDRLATIRTLAPFGINFVVNARTLPDLNAAAALAGGFGAKELLLLPEQPVHGRGGIDLKTAQALRHWVHHYRGAIPLTVSEAGAAGLPTCNPAAHEVGLLAYAHIDAAGVIKRSSYDQEGIPIGQEGLMRALHQLRTQYQEAPQ